ncbi:hypothetical protein [Phenylobacterium sp.]|uniref:hypothetical protein n=1 Tax=Phenylobacterium sp. TaxID=1871053 RepID=UPI002E339A70|nr:hypothetical protein [Phenylobacterium sp.]
MTVFAGLVFTAVRYVDLPVGQALHAALIAAPASWLARTRPHRIAIILVLLIGAALVWMEIGPLLMAADVAPVLWFADLSLYLDALLMVAVAFAAVQVRSIGRLASGVLRGTLGARFVRQRARARSSSPRRPKRPPPANDDAPGFAIRMTA